MLELVFIRHGQTEYNATRKVMGRRPIPLNEMGRGQAASVAKRLEGVELNAIFTSPMRRAVETSEIIAAGRNGMKVEPNEGLAELDYGDWIGLDFDELINERAEEWNSYRKDPANMKFPGGKSVREESKRIGAFMDEVVNGFEKGRVALVSHADVIKVAMLHALGMDLDHIRRFTLDNCAICMVRISKGLGAKLVMLGCASGLATEAMNLDPREDK